MLILNPGSVTAGGNIFCAISFNVHDSSVAFALDEKVVLVLEAERIFKVKKKVCSKSEMEYLISYGLSYLEMKLEDAGMKIIPQRIAVLLALMDNRNHPSAND